MIASEINIAEYAGLLLGGRTVLHGIASISLQLISSGTSNAAYGFRIMYIIEYIYMARVQYIITTITNAVVLSL